MYTNPTEPPTQATTATSTGREPADRWEEIFQNPGHTGQTWACVAAAIDWAAVVLKAALIVGVGVLVAVAVRIVRSRESKSDVVRAGERSQRPDPGPKSGRS